METIGRRTLLSLLAGLGLAGGSPITLLAGTPRSIVRAGRFPPGSALQGAAEDLRDEIEAAPARRIVEEILESAATPDEALARLRRQSRADFAARRWVAWQGWRLSHTEAALIFLLAGEADR